jgi:N-acetylneuraminic acid mutarotase
MKRWLLGLALVGLFPAVSRAHFLWLLTESQGGARKVAVYFEEDAQPGDPALLEKVKGAEAWAIRPDGQATPIALSVGDDELLGDVSESAVAIVLRHHYGVLARGPEPFLLNYYAKTYLSSSPGDWKAIGDSERLPLEIVPEIDASGAVLRVDWKGKPVEGAIVTVLGPGIAEKSEGTTDSEGKFRCALPEAGLYSIRARHVEETPGKLGDSEYRSVRHYSTLTLEHLPQPLALVNHQLPDLPKGVTSIGGAIVGDTLMVFGGNYGSAHEYANEDQSGDMWSLDLAKPGEWRQVAVGPKLQGLAMVEHRGNVYRVGGFTAANNRGEENDLRSQAEFARWNPENQNWDSLPPLPEARSSHDAAVVGDTLYVVGGWNMPGAGKERSWHETALAIDLAAESPEWKEIPAPPFKRRALTLAAFEDKLYCIGGMNEEGGPTTAVAIYDPKTQTWSEGPALEGEPMDGFGASAFACQGALYVTSLSPSVQKLASGSAKWERAGELDHPRFFHRMLPWGDSKLVVVGGGNMTEGKTLSVELLSIGK